MTDEPLILDGSPLSLADVEAVARHGRSVRVDDATGKSLAATRQVVSRHADDVRAIYGVNTGFGSLAIQRIAPDDVRNVQINLLRSHAAGVGEPLEEDVVRAMMVIAAASLARNRSGVRPEVIDLLCAFLNRRITPVVPSRGSVGASGDLAPLAHLALALIGEAEVFYAEQRVPAGLALKQTGLSPVTLQGKEGLALINGTHMMTAIAALGLCDTDRLSEASVCAGAMAVDACRATDRPFDARLHQARNQPGQQRVAELVRNLLEGSTILPSHKEDDPRVQDPYCLRCIPQVLGAVLDTVDFMRYVVLRELGGVTDNPLVFETEDKNDVEFLSGGNFHGMPIAIALDTLKIALTHIAGIAERRIFWLLAASDSENPVNVYLSPQPGLHSGLMIPQYTAAACCNELRTLATPASVSNISTSAGMEDYNSMGATSALHARTAVELATQVVAIEFLVMAEALEYQRPLQSGNAIERAHQVIRKAVPKLIADRSAAPDIKRIVGLIRQGEFEYEHLIHSES